MLRGQVHREVLEPGRRGGERVRVPRTASHALSQRPLLIQEGVHALGKLGVVMT